MDGSVLSLAARMLASLVVVIVLMALAARLARRQGLLGPRPAGGRARLEVLARHAMGRSSSVAVVRAGGRTLLLGVTEHQIRVLSEVDPEPVAQSVSVALDEPPAAGDGGPAWTALVAALRERTVRRS